MTQPHRQSTHFSLVTLCHHCGWFTSLESPPSALLSVLLMLPPLPLMPALPLQVIARNEHAGDTAAGRDGSDADDEMSLSYDSLKAMADGDDKVCLFLASLSIY